LSTDIEALADQDPAGICLASDPVQTVELFGKRVLPEL
jgi:hypothetical protein